MYCEDSTGEIQPMTHATFAKLAEAYERDLGFSYKFVDRGEKRAGEPYQVLLFSNGEDGGSYEGVGYIVTRHADGLAVRLSYAQFAGQPAEKTSGTDMCMLIQTISMVGFRSPPGEPQESAPQPMSGRRDYDRNREAEEQARLRRIEQHEDRVRCYAHDSLPC